MRKMILWTIVLLGPLTWTTTAQAIFGIPDVAALAQRVTIIANQGIQIGHAVSGLRRATEQFNKLKQQYDHLREQALGEIGALTAPLTEIAALPGQLVGAGLLARRLYPHRRGRAGGCARPVQQRRHAADGLLARPLERRARRHRTTGPDRVQHAPRRAGGPRGRELPPRRRSRRTPDGHESWCERRRSVGHVHGEIGARFPGRAARTNQRLRHRAPASPGGRPHHQRGSDGRARATARLPGDPGDGPGTRSRGAAART